jgi:pimeloyl-ACP methyl ester carboxylesterase
MMSTLLGVFVALLTTPALGQEGSTDGGTTSGKPPITINGVPAPAPPGFQHQTAVVNGITLHYVRGGVGPPLVLIHGWPQNWHMWNRIMPALAANYTVIVPDLRGAGESAKPATGYTKRQMADDIHKLVQQLGFGSQLVSLVGHDIGAMVAYAYAADHPSDVRRLVLMEAPLPGIEPYWSLLTKDKRGWHIGFHTEGTTAEMLVLNRERDYIVSFYDKWSYNMTSTFTTAEVDEADRVYSAPGAMATSFKWYRTFDDDVLDNQVLSQNKLTMPVLALGGDASSSTVVLSSAQAVAYNATGGAVAQCGHWIPQEKPTELLQQLTTFLQ